MRGIVVHITRMKFWRFTNGEAIHVVLLGEQTDIEMAALAYQMPLHVTRLKTMNYLLQLTRMITN